MEIPEEYDPNIDDGTFFMCYKDWRTLFSNLFICINFPVEWSGLRFKDSFKQALNYGPPKKNIEDSLEKYC